MAAWQNVHLKTVMADAVCVSRQACMKAEIVECVNVRRSLLRLHQVQPVNANMYPSEERR